MSDTGWERVKRAAEYAEPRGVLGETTCHCCGAYQDIAGELVQDPMYVDHDGAWKVCRVCLADRQHFEALEDEIRAFLFEWVGACEKRNIPHKLIYQVLDSVTTELVQWAPDMARASRPGAEA